MDHKPKTQTKTARLIAANDNEPIVRVEDFDSLPVIEAELRLIETHFAPILAELIAVNDNEE